MKKIKIFFILIIFILLLLWSKNVSAVGTISLSTSKSTVEVGEEFSISVNLSGASVATLTTRVTVDTSKVDYVSGPSNSSFVNGRAIYTWTDPTGGENPKTSGTIATFKFKAKQAGNASFSVNGDFYSSEEEKVNPSFLGAVVTIKEKEVTPPSNEENNGNGNNSGGNTGAGSGDGEGNGNTNNSGGSLGGTTNKPTTGNNNSGGENTATVSQNANLQELHLNVEGLTPSFNKNTTNYNIVIDNTIKNISITAIPEDKNAKVSITGNTNLQVGINKILIKVTAQDNNTIKTYTINVTKTDNPDLANANLENLAIENVTLNPEFNEEVLQYTAEIESDINVLNILAVPKIEGATVSIQGNENIVFGENVITISVIAKDGVTKKDYIINLYKKTLQEENNQELLELETNGINEANEMNNKESIKIGSIVFSAIVLIGIGGIIFIIVRKYAKERDKRR